MKYFYCPMTSRRLYQRMTLADRFRRWQRIRRNRKSDAMYFPLGSYNAPVYPGK